MHITDILITCDQSFSQMRNDLRLASQAIATPVTDIAMLSWQK
jgi:hypothetical protein